MSDLHWFQLLFTVSTVVWVAAGALFGSIYMATWWRERRFRPFIVSNAFIAASNLAESAMYFTVVWWFASNETAGKVALYYIPAGLVVRAVAFSLVGWWVMYHSRSGAIS